MADLWAKLGSTPTSVKAGRHIPAWSMLVGIDVKRMAELLKSGATMLQETCPECHTPLFRKGKDTFCPKCNRPVVIIQSAEDEARLMTNKVFDSSEQTLLAKIQEINVALKNETDPTRLLTYSSAMTSWLDAIEKIRRLRRQDGA